MNSIKHPPNPSMLLSNSASKGSYRVKNTESIFFKEEDYSKGS